MISSRAQVNLFFVGIGGMGMAPLAVYLREAGWPVSGYDDDLRPGARALLEDSGINPCESASLPDDAELLVYSSAVKADHPVMLEAIARGLKTVRRGSMMAEAVAGKKLIAVVGSHGKTTTAGMLVHALEKAGFSVDYILGGLFSDSKRKPASFGGSEWVVAEIDESDGTIEEFCPEVTLLLNTDWDHPDLYRSPEAVSAAFGRILKRTAGHIFYQAGSDCLRNLAAKSDTPSASFGDAGDYDLRSFDLCNRTLSIHLGGRFADVSAGVRAAGGFNAVNATAAFAVTNHLTGGIVSDYLADFPGILRRQTCLYDVGGTTVLEDYAHHPTEIRALLDFAAQGYMGRRLIVVFQPHRYSRTLQYKREFATSLNRADQIFLLDVYPACENPLPGGATEDLYAHLRDARLKTHRVASPADLWASIQPHLGTPSLLLFIGAGDIDRWSPEVVRRLNAAEYHEVVRIPPDETTWWRTLALKMGSRSQFRFNESLAKKTTLRIGGPALVYAEPAGVDELGGLLKAARERKLPVFFLGRGSNLIVPDSGFRGLVIRLNGPEWSEIRQLPENRIYARAGARLKQICGETCKSGLTGFEFLEGIPGSVGGALRMNAGAMGASIFDIVEEVSVMTLDGVLSTLTRKQVHVSYRECEELREAVAVSAVLRGSGRETPELIRAKIGDFTRKRRESQPREPSSGCIFKNPKGHFAGELIDELGLKGLRVGAAQVSELHGNFIVNRGGATSSDVIGLIQSIRREVKDRRGIVLQPEVLLMGQKWGDGV